MQPSRKIQEIIDVIAADRQSLLASVSGLTQAQLDYKPSEDGWSISDILHHLALSDEANVRLATNMLKHAEEKNVPRDDSPDASVLGCLDEFSGPLRTKVKAPARVNPRDYLASAESLARLDASRARLNECIVQLGQYDLSQLVYPHPFLGELNMYHWLLLAGGHERRHTVQIGRLKSAEGFPTGASAAS
ncbi:MAG TPA: DinB family protein [Blastocatellia bacterium]|nr:DinB family protein [Blastocatellia bacterium]